MRRPRSIRVENTVFDFLDWPHYAVAHPQEAEQFEWNTDSTGPCQRCALGIRRDTGDIVLLWCCGDKNWGISREDPNYRVHYAHVQLNAMFKKVYEGPVVSIFG